MNTIEKYYRDFRKNSPFMLVGNNAKLALDSARTLSEWNEMESRGLVRIRAEHEEESYFDVFGMPDTEEERNAIIELIKRLGCYRVTSEYKTRDGWEHADSVGMCIYNDPIDPFENCYVIDHMQSAIDQYKAEAYSVCP